MNANKALEKLSSGYKINRAGDDAAGLAISEKMRGQIRGLEMATKNAQDSISLIQTAEGAMNEVHAMLQRGRELAVQAANDTNVADDREALQKEIEQIKTEINSVRDRTEFNTQKLLKGGLAGSFTPEDVDALTNKLKDYMLEGAEKILEADYGLTGLSLRDIEVNFTAEGAGGWAAYVSTSVQGGQMEFGLTFDMDDVVGMNDASLESLVVHEMTHAMMASKAGTNWHDYPRWFKEGTAELITGANNRVQNNFGANPTASITTYLNILESTDRAEYEQSEFYSISVLSTKYLDDQLKANGSTNGIKDIISELGTSADLDAAIKAVTSNNYDLTQFKSDLTSAAGIAAMEAYVTGNQVGPYNGARSPADLITTTDALDEATNFKYNWVDGKEGPSELIFQIGANEGQTLKLKLPNISTSSLGIGQASVATRGEAEKAITSFDDAIKKVSEQRSNLGAVQNRLEHTINNLGTASENLTAAESRIRDTDMAKEMMNFTKQNILMQAAQSMLAQANQQPQGVLQLLG